MARAISNLIKYDKIDLGQQVSFGAAGFIWRDVRVELCDFWSGFKLYLDLVMCQTQFINYDTLK